MTLGYYASAHVEAAGGGSLSYVGSDFDFTDGGDITLTIPAATLPGDIMVADIGQGNDGAMTGPAGWSYDNINVNGKLTVNSFTRVAQSGDAGTATTFVNTNKLAGHITVFRDETTHSFALEDDDALPIVAPGGTSTADGSIQLAIFFERSQQVTELIAPTELDFTLIGTAIGSGGSHTGILLGTRPVDAGAFPATEANTGGGSVQRVTGITRLFTA